MKTVRIKTANRPSSLPKAKLRKVVAAAFAKRPLPRPMSKEEEKLLEATFIPVIITPNKLKK